MITEEKFIEYLKVLNDIREKEEKINEALEIEGHTELFDTAFDTIVKLLEDIFGDDEEILSNWIYFDNSTKPTVSLYDILTKE